MPQPDNRPDLIADTRASNHEKDGRHGFRFWLIVVLVLLAVLAVWGIVSRLHASHTLKKNTEKNATLVVSIVHPETISTGSDIVLPGNVHAWHESSLSARVSGYLKTWNKDIGDRVKAGDVLAEIDTPETDQQLQQAQADLALAIANNDLAQITAKRWLALLKTDTVSRQDADEKVADARAKTAQVLSETASRDRLRELESFKKIIAPFDGIVTARSTDLGALINANGGELYHVSTTDLLRVYVNVPEIYAAALSPQTVADLNFSEYPGQTFAAKLLDTAGSLDPVNRTLLAQFTLANPGGKLFPGGFCEVHLKSPQPAATLRLPVNAFIFQSNGLQIALVGADHKITLRSVTPGRDFGTAIEVIAGLPAQADVVLNPPDSLYQGETVRIAPQPRPDGGREQQEAKDQQAKEPDNKDDKKTDQKQPAPQKNSGQSQKTDQVPGTVSDDNGQKDENTVPAPDQSSGNAGKNDKKDKSDKSGKSSDPNTKDDAQ